MLRFSRAGYSVGVGDLGTQEGAGEDHVVGFEVTDDLFLLGMGRGRGCQQKREPDH